MARKAISKGLRFEVFKRDGFRCRYCGATPSQSTLNVDHVIPVSGGGTNDPANLVTACYDCNAGKSATPVDDVRIPPTRSPEEIREQVEQVRACAENQEALEDAIDEMFEVVRRHWIRMIDYPSPYWESRLRSLVKSDPIEVIMEAIEITGRTRRSALDQQKYFYGVRRKLLEAR